MINIINNVPNRAEHPGRGGQPEVRLRDPVQREGQLPTRHPRHPAVQTCRVRNPDQPEHGQRVGSRQVHPGPHHAAEGDAVIRLTLN